MPGAGMRETPESVGRGLPRGSGYNRVVGPDNTAPAGLAPEQLLYDGRVLPAVIRLEHERGPTHPTGGALPTRRTTWRGGRGSDPRPAGRGDGVARRVPVA